MSLLFVPVLLLGVLWVLSVLSKPKDEPLKTLSEMTNAEYAAWKRNR